MTRRNAYRFPFSRYPAVRLALIVSSGILFSRIFSLPFYFSALSSALMIILTLLLEWVNRHSLQAGLMHLSTVCYLLTFFAFGTTVYSGLTPENRIPDAARWMQQFEWEQMQLSGTVRSVRQTDSLRGYIDLDIDTVLAGSGQQRYSIPSLGVRGLVKGGPSSQLPAPGSRIHAVLTAYPLDGPRNPGDFDYRSFLYDRHIYLQGRLNSWTLQKEAPSSLNWMTIRRSALQAAGSIFPERLTPLARALLIGYKNELPRQERKAFSRVGLAHLMAVSGLHVGFLVAPFWFFIPLLRRRKRIAVSALLVLGFVLFFYSGLTGFSSSVTRASLMAGFLAYSRLFGKPGDAVNLAAAAALLLLLIRPADLFTIGFQLSFGAVFIILLTWPVLMHYLPDWIRFRWYGKPVGILLLSLVVQIGLFPMVSWYFGEFSLIGPLMNALFVLPLAFAIPWSMLCTLFSALGLPGAALLNLPSAWLIALLKDAVSVANGFKAAWVTVQLQQPLIFVVWLTGLLWMASWRIPPMRWKMLTVFMAGLCLWQGARTFQKLEPKRMRLVMFDVGQGDATLVTTPGGHHLLVDTGRWRPGYNSGESVILPFLKSRGIEHINAVVLSHPHADHIGGIEALLRNVRIDTIYTSGYPYTSKLFRRYHRLARRKGVPLQAVHAGRFLQLDPSMQIMVLGPDFRPLHSEPNEHSVILLMAYGRNRFLFMGDGGTTQEKQLMKHYGKLLDADFLKVGHHASETASSAAFLDSVTARIAAVSLGLHNRYRHPHRSAVARLAGHTGELSFTSLDGALVFESDGKSLRRVSWK